MCVWTVNNPTVDKCNVQPRCQRRGWGHPENTRRMLQPVCEYPTQRTMAFVKFSRIQLLSTSPTWVRDPSSYPGTHVSGTNRSIPCMCVCVCVCCPGPGSTSPRPGYICFCNLNKNRFRVHTRITHSLTVFSFFLSFYFIFLVFFWVSFCSGPEPPSIAAFYCRIGYIISFTSGYE